LSAEELLDLERARLALLRYGAAADRGRIVREAIAVLLADLDARGKDSLLARRIASENRAIEQQGADGNGAAENRPGENRASGNQASAIQGSAIQGSANQGSGNGLHRSVQDRTPASVP